MVTSFVGKWADDCQIVSCRLLWQRVGAEDSNLNGFLSAVRFQPKQFSELASVRKRDILNWSSLKSKQLFEIDGTGMGDPLGNYIIVIVKNWMAQKFI